MTFEFAVQPEFLTLQKEWAEKYRAPITHSLRHDQWVVAALWVPLADDSLVDIWKVQMPSEEDAALLGDYIEYKLKRWYDQHYITNVLGVKPLDIDQGVNTQVFLKSQVGWHYNRSSWRDGAPFQPSLFVEPEKQNPSLLSAMNLSEGKHAHGSWAVFVAEHGGL